MKKLVLALLLALGLFTPARAVELIVNYPSTAVLVQLAAALGYYNAAQSQVVIAGGLAASGGYFINVVGPVVATPAVYDTATPPNLITAAVMAPGLWLRIRHNADPAILTARMTPTFLTQATGLGVVIYQWAQTLNSGAGCWSSDGATCAPAYIATIGQIM
jgi:hypothetical protein